MSGLRRISVGSCFWRARVEMGWVGREMNGEFTWKWWGDMGVVLTMCR